VAAGAKDALWPSPLSAGLSMRLNFQGAQNPGGGSLPERDAVPKRIKPISIER
jgi:hypothetical protein